MNGGEAELVLDDVLELLVEGHQLLLVSKLVREVEPQPSVEITLHSYTQGDDELLVAN